MENKNPPINPPISIFGHKNPDSDTVLSAIILAEFFNIRGNATATPFVLGKINGESSYILDKYGVAHPQLLNSIDQIADTQIAIVDTTNPNHLPDGVDKMPIVMIVDHHQLGGLTTTNACEVWGRKYGATCTILYELFLYYGIPMSKTISALTLCGILADTLCFASPTTTERDKTTAQKLAELLSADITALWNELLTAKSDISNLTDRELLTQDAKEFVFGGKSFFIGNIEIADATPVISRLDGIKAEMQTLKTEKDYFAVLLCVIDLSAENTLFLSFTDDNEKIEQLFSVKFTNNTATINRLISRKKDIVSVLQGGF
jgi:manganese-dependent inorganic pyrophosphatase